MKSAHKLPYFFIVIYIVFFYISSFITGLLLDSKNMIFLTALVVIYWFTATTLMRLFSKPQRLKQLLLKTTISVGVIMLVTSLQQALFINTPYSFSFLFFAISLILLLLLHTLYFSWKLTSNIPD